MVDGFAKTPRYVLKNGSRPLGPTIQPTPSVALSSSPSRATSNVPPKCLFGFSGKPTYDAFLSKSTLALTPYPLVHGFLRNEAAEHSEGLNLVVLDAESPSQSQFLAATVQAVWDATQADSPQVVASHELMLDATSGEYRCQSRAESTLRS